MPKPSYIPFHNISNSDSIFVNTSQLHLTFDSPSFSPSSDNCSQVDSSKAYTTQTTRIKCLSLNARSVVNKRPDLQALLDVQGLDVLAETETFLSGVILDSELISDEFTIFRRDRDRHGEG